MGADRRPGLRRRVAHSSRPQPQESGPVRRADHGLASGRRATHNDSSAHGAKRAAVSWPP